MAAAEMSDESSIVFRAKFQGQIIELPPLNAEVVRVSDLKRLLQDESSVPVARQKLLGLVKGKLPPDDTMLSDLLKSGIATKVRFQIMKLKISASRITILQSNSYVLAYKPQGPPYTFSLMGTTDEKLFVDPADRDDLPEVRYYKATL
jgi:hypothetical protein